jgi:tetratricopeptide (TPR) repeat protein
MIEPEGQIMNSNGGLVSPAPKLDRLLGFLEIDPDNRQIIADAATEAFAQGRLEVASDLLDRNAQLAPLPPELQNLKGLIALRRGQFDEAADVFGALRATNDEPATRFNLAWAKAMLADYEGASSLLDERTMAAIPRAAVLKVHALHHLQQLDEALACGASLAEFHPQHQALFGALALVAVDADDMGLARTYAERAGATHEGLSTLGMLQLNDNQVDVALDLFGKALAVDANSPRALLGEGLALLVKGEAAGSAARLDRAAAIFADHLGSWVAAGWAHFANADYKSSRDRFDTAMALDDSLAETHGALAILDFLEGHIESASRRADVALRLDRACLSGAMAKTLLLAKDGDLRSSARIRDKMLKTPVGLNGETIEQMMLTFGMAGPKAPDQF